MERRLYQRTNVALDTGFYLEGVESSNREFVGKIVDISEGGIKVCIADDGSKGLASELSIGSVISFQAIDSYFYLAKHRTDFVQGMAVVVRTATKNDMLILGCKIIKLDAELKNYISNKRMCSFADTGYRVIK